MMSASPVDEDDTLTSWLRSRRQSSSNLTELIERLLADITTAGANCFKIRQESTFSSPLHCSCGSILYEPVTQKDGSSQCKSCVDEQERRRKLTEEEGGGNWVAVNVLLAGIVRECCKDHVQSVEIRMRGDDALLAGENDEASKLYTMALTLARDDPITLIRRAEAQALQGLYSEALEDTSKALALSPKQWKSHHHKAEVLKALGRTEESLASFVACLVLREDVMLRQHVVVILDQYLSTDAENSVSDGSFQKLHRVFYLCSKELNPNSVLPSGSFQGSLALEDFDCVLCGRLLYKPVTTPCGHVFCRSCLNRSLDHRPSCPTCRGALSEYLASVLGRSECVTEAIERMIQQFFSDDYRTRDQLYRQELRQLAGPPLGHLPVEADIPVLVCGAAFPSVSCPLHIYEPCYRLMLRRCLESNSYQFGMCQPSEQSQLAPVGTMLRVRGVQFIADGRSMVDAVGGKRFKVLKYGMLDGYGRAVVRFFSDEKVQSGPELIALCTKVHEATKNWFTSLSTVIKDRITGCFGPLPQYNPTSDPQSKDDGPDWVWWACAALQGQFQAANVLALTSLKDRLQMLQHFVDEQANVMELCRPQ